MKKLLTTKNIFQPLAFMLLVLTGLNACKKDDAIEPKIFFNTEDTLSVSNKANEQRVVIVSNMNWTAQADVDWITISKTEGEKGQDTVRFSVAKNEDDERTGIITITTASGSLAKEITVVQESGLTSNFYVKAGASGEGRSWNNASSLDYALKNSVSGSVIHIAAGTYVPETTVTGGDAADPNDITFEVNKNITLKGGYPSNVSDKTTPADPAVNKTILSGKLANGESYHVVTISAPKVEEQKVVLDGLTIREGNGFKRGSKVTINGIEFSRGNGGGISIGGSVVDLIDVNVVDNKTSGSGGDAGYAAGMFVFGDAEVTLTRCKVNNNKSSGNGGGLWVDRSTAYIYDSEFNENESPGTAPGVHGYPDASIYMYNSTVANNKGNSYGAGFYIRAKTKAVLVNCLIYGNESAKTNGGGGVMMYDNCEADIISSTITKNNIAGPGGGICREKGENKLRIYNSIVSGNTQAASSSDLDSKGSGLAVPVIKASVISDKAYNAAGTEISGVSFNPAVMLNASFIPVGSSNPALTSGMDAAALNTLGASFTPPLEGLISSDKNGNSRSGVSIMGALVK